MCLRAEVNWNNRPQHVIGCYICIKGDNHVILALLNEPGNGGFEHAACDRAGRAH